MHLDRDAAVARLQDGKKFWRGKKRVEGRHPYGQHPGHEYDAEQAVAARIRSDKASGVSSCTIAKHLNAEGTRTRYGCKFTTKTVAEHPSQTCAVDHPAQGRTEQPRYEQRLDICCAVS